MSSFVEATPQWAPPDYADVRAAWTGPHPSVKDVTLRIEAAAYRGKPCSSMSSVHGQIPNGWSRTGSPSPIRSSSPLIFATLGVLIAAAGVLARRHIRTNRADRRGAWRVTAYLAIAGLLSWVLRASHSSNLEGEIGLFFRSAGILALLGVIFWTLYVAVEPYVRRFWPDALLGWSRLLSGHIRDPRVGRDLLIGMVFGVALILVDAGKATIIPALGFSAPYARYGFGEEMFGDSAAAFWAVLVRECQCDRRRAVHRLRYRHCAARAARPLARDRRHDAVPVADCRTYDMSAMPYALVFPLTSGALLTLHRHAFRSPVARGRVVHVEAARRGSA